jgi:hypothetical protein
MYQIVKQENIEIKKEPNIFPQLFVFVDISIVLFLFKTHCFGGWILSPSSGGSHPVEPNR